MLVGTIGFVASFLAPSLAIIIGSLGVVIATRSVDITLDGLFTSLAMANAAREKREKIQALVEELLPALDA